MRFYSILTMIILLIMTASCKKEYTVVDPIINIVPNTPYSQTYIGETHLKVESVDSSIVSVLRDTIYLDTMLVSYRNDSVFFALNQSADAFSVPPGYDNGFKVNPSNYYQLDIKPFGGALIVNHSHEFKAMDSLKSYRSHLDRVSGQQVIYDFIGKK